MRDFIKFLFYNRIPRFIICWMVIAVAGLVFAEKTFHYIHMHSSELYTARGVCFFKYGNEAGCFGVDSVDLCKNKLLHGGAEFVKYVPNADPHESGCFFASKAIHTLFSNTEASRYLNDFSFPLRSVINHKSGPQLFENKTITSRYLPVAYFFIIVFLTLLYFKRKHEFISIPFIFLISLFTACLTLSIENISGSFQLFVKISDSVYLLSDIIFLICFLYAFIYVICAAIYHKIQFDKGEITPLVMSLIFLTDKAKSKFNL